jgi:23S rRNA (cytosine1962-C5)-methyltransferase
VIFNDKRDFAAIGLWDPHSPIRIRIVHKGKPVQIDQAFWHSRLAAALQHRQPLLGAADNTGIRLVNGENDQLPGLIVDQYADIIVIKLYSGAWAPFLDAIVESLCDLRSPTTILLRLARDTARNIAYPLADGLVLRGPPPPDCVWFKENGLAFGCSPATGQKTGTFLDQRDNRALVGRHSQDASVLDVFCCSGGFSVHAAAGGARLVHSVDISHHAIREVSANLDANRALFRAGLTSEATVGDAFEVMEALVRRGQRFDIVVIDPPSFAPRESAVSMALRAYQRLTALGLQLVNDGGLLFQASCSSRVSADDFYATVHLQADLSGVTLTEIERTGHTLDHRIDFVHGAYLKALLARVHR